MISNVSFEQICNIKIHLLNEKEEKSLISRGYVPLGLGLFFHPEYLLNFDPCWQELIQYPFDRICQYFKVKRKCVDLIGWFKYLKNKFVLELTTNNNEKENIDALVNEIILKHNVGQNCKILSQYIDSRDIALFKLYGENDAIIQLFTNKKIVELIQFFKNMLEILTEDQETQYDENTYTVSSLSSSKFSRYLQSQNFTPPNSPKRVLTSNLNEPLLWLIQFNIIHHHNSLKCICFICHEIDIPFIIIRNSLSYNKLKEINNSPMKYFYSEMVCSKCAAYFCEFKIDPEGFSCYSAIPLINLMDISKRHFISSCLKLFSPPNDETEEEFYFESGNYFINLFINIINTGKKFINDSSLNRETYAERKSLYQLLLLICYTLKTVSHLDKEKIRIINMFEKNLDKILT